MSISDVIVLLLPVIVFTTLWLFHWLEQRMPANQRAALDQFVRIAIKCIEQTNKGTSSQKKNAAISLTCSLFRKFNLPVPSYTIIDAAIEALIWEMNQAKIPDEFFDGDRRAINTGPIKPVLPPPDSGGQPV